MLAPAEIFAVAVVAWLIGLGAASILSLVVGDVAVLPLAAMSVFPWAGTVTLFGWPLAVVLSSRRLRSCSDVVVVAIALVSAIVPTMLWQAEHTWSLRFPALTATNGLVWGQFSVSTAVFLLLVRKMSM